MADYTIKKPIGISYDMIVRVDHLIILDDFLILDCEVNFEMPIILGRPFIHTGREIGDMEKEELRFRVKKEELIFNVYRIMK